jgi:hypothetical protein
MERKEQMFYYTGVEGNTGRLSRLNRLDKEPVDLTFQTKDEEGACGL